jgi:hypothetical protein
LFGALEYDLMRYMNGTDVRGLYTKTITYRQVATWIRHLPEDSALSRRGWGGDVKSSFREKLMVATINELRQGNHNYVLAHTDEDSARNIPDPVYIELHD